jgi:hypothetical protein
LCVYDHAPKRQPKKEIGNGIDMMFAAEDEIDVRVTTASGEYFVSVVVIRIFFG